MGTAVLTHYPVVSSNDPADWIPKVNAFFQLSGARPLHEARTSERFVLNGFHGADFSIGYIATDVSVNLGGVHAPERSYYVNFGLSGELIAVRGEEQALSTRGNVVVFNPGDRTVMRPLGGPADTLGIRLDRDLVNAELADLLGREPGSEPRFDLTLDLTDPDAFGLQHLVGGMLDQFDSGIPSLEHPAIRRAEVRAFVISLLLTHRHSFSEQLRTGGSPLRPRTVRRATEFIDDHFAEPLTLGEIAAATGRSARSVHDAFHAAFGLSPMTYLRNVRLEHARAALRGGDDPVGSIAIACGFTHFGRFANAYRHRFGELPSRTRAT